MERRQSTIERQLTRARLFHRQRLRLAHYGRETNFRLGVLSGPSGSLVSFSVCEGFRMPAAHGPCRALWRPASENLQGRKPREMRV